VTLSRIIILAAFDHAAQQDRKSGATMPDNVAASLLHHDGRADRDPVIEICDVLVPHPEAAG
jgi:cell wall assembly regulator SMI1